jgi:general secretion pathway protein D
VRMDFQNASLREVVEAFLRDYLKRPYSFLDSFKDKQVSLHLEAGKTDQAELQRMFDSFLNLHGVTLKYIDGIYMVGMDTAGPQRPAPGGIGDSIGIFRLGYIDAKDFLAVAKNVLSKPEQAVQLSPGSNAVVVTASGVDVRAVSNLVKEIDIPFFKEKRVILYAPKHLSAAGLVTLIDNYLEQLGATGTKPNRQIEARAVPDLDRVVLIAANKNARDMIIEYLARTDAPGANQRRLYQYRLTTQKAAELAPGIGELIKQMLRGTTEIKPLPDKETNSLFFNATPEEYAEIRRLLLRLDARPASVHVDITIAEVILNDTLQYGVEWYLSHSNGLLADLTVDLAQNLRSGAVLGLVDGSNYLALEMLATVTNFGILSSPQILVRNGVTAKIVVGGEEPVVKSVLTSETTSGGTNLPQTEYGKEKIGLELEVTPSIGNDGNVKLALSLKDVRISGEKIFQDARQPVLTNREVKTELVVRDGGTIFLGGIRQKRSSNASSQIPGMADLPLIGKLFNNQNNSSETTELIILATPTVIWDQDGADLLTRALARAVESSQKPATAPSPSTKPAEGPSGA